MASVIGVLSAAVAGLGRARRRPGRSGLQRLQVRVRGRGELRHALLAAELDELSAVQVAQRRVAQRLARHDAGVERIGGELGLDQRGVDLVQAGVRGGGELRATGHSGEPHDRHAARIWEWPSAPCRRCRDVHQDDGRQADDGGGSGVDACYSGQQPTSGRLSMLKPRTPVVLFALPILLGCPHSHAGHLHHQAARAVTLPAPSQCEPEALVPPGGAGANASSIEVTVSSPSAPTTCTM
jgi:hypothetical protein